MQISFQGKGKSKGKGKCSARFPSKNGKRDGACNDVESSDSETEQTNRRKKTTKKVR